MEEDDFEVRHGEMVADLVGVAFCSHIEIPGFQGVLHEFAINWVVFDDEC
ncbi:MAG: hypothetical protein RL421_95 [Actinomycetota bacterium]